MERYYKELLGSETAAGLEDERENLINLQEKHDTTSGNKSG